MTRAQEAHRHSSINEGEQPVVIPGNIQEPTRLHVNSELTPRPCFEQFFHRPGPTRQRHKALSKFCHSGFSIMHALHYAKLGEVGVGYLALHERARDHADHFAPMGEYRIGQHAHEPDACASVDKADSFISQEMAERTYLFAKGSSVPQARAAKHAEAHGSSPPRASALRGRLGTRVERHRGVIGQPVSRCRRRRGVPTG